MDYIKLSYTITPHNEEIREILMAQLGEIGFESFLEVESGLEAYIPKKDFNQDRLAELTITLHEEFEFTFEIEEIPDQNWNEVWEKNYFQPIQIGDQCVVRSPHHKDVPQAKYEIFIEPKMSFGTGHHETTGLVMKYLLGIDCQNLDILDMGCGSGILGILAAKLGAKSVFGIDIDEWAYFNTIENLELNGVSTMSVKQGDASLLGDKIYDLVLANINRNILLEDIKHYSKVTKSGGTIIMSGFYESDLPMIKEEAEQQGYQFQRCELDNNWCAALFTKV